MSRDDDKVLADQVLPLGLSEDEFWSILERKGVRRRCGECSQLPNAELLMRTDDTGDAVLSTVLAAIRNNDGNVFLHTHDTASIYCPNCGFIRTFSMKVLKGA